LGAWRDAADAASKPRAAVFTGTITNPGAAVVSVTAVPIVSHVHAAVASGPVAAEVAVTAVTTVTVTRR
jgi:hypothetical protein